jgi:hypothetical protein
VHTANLVFLLALAQNAPKLEPITLATDLRGGYQVLAVDLNRDGHEDLIGLASGLDHLDWFENPGAKGGEWRRHVLASGFRQLINVAALDLDRDGVPELLVAHEFSNIPARSFGTVSLLRHDGDPTKPWRREDIENRPTSHRLKVANGQFVNAPLAHPKAEAPEYRQSVPLVVYAGTPLQPKVVAESDAGVMHGLAIFDYNGDGRDDIFTASFGGIAVYVAKARGGYARELLHEGSAAAWPKSGSSEIALVRLGKGKKGPFQLASIDPWHGNEFAIYTREGKGWKREVLDKEFEEGHTLLPLDLDGDGAEEIVYGSRKQGGTLRVAQWQAKEKRWAITRLLEGKLATSSCVSLEANGDGKIDFACIGGASQNLMVFLNRR